MPRSAAALLARSRCLARGRVRSACVSRARRVEQDAHKRPKEGVHAGQETECQEREAVREAQGEGDVEGARRADRQFAGCLEPRWQEVRFIPGSTRFSSSKASSPFSWSHSDPDSGSKAIPKLLRTPYAKIFWTFAPTSPPIASPAANRGLSVGVVPSSFKRRITPA